MTKIQPRLKRRFWQQALPVLFVASWLCSAAGAQPDAEEPVLRTLDPQLFPLPETLRPNVDFWTLVYTAYSSDHVLLHDELHLSVVYAVLDFSLLQDLPESRRQARRRQEIRQAEAKYRSILQDLAAGRVSQDHPEDQERVARLFESIPGPLSKHSAAAGRLRTQTCLADRFAEGIERSGRFMEKFEETFRRRGLPVELTRMAFVESLFQTHAHSSAAAAGIWQFVRSTARHYLDMELEYDERYDPWRATEAAARLLEHNYAELGNWPLAVTAYNHGSNGMKRAVRTHGTRDLGAIVESYRSRTFGFASRNFYAEFLAAATIYENREHYFPETRPDPPIEFDVYVTESFVSVRELAERAATSLEELKLLNPALVREVWAENLFVPQGYALRVPQGRQEAFHTAYVALPAEAVAAHQVGLRYRVQNGDTLGKIATRFGTSVAALQRANNLRSPHLIHQGQKLLIPPGRGRAGTTSTAAAGAPTTHVVRRGESLSTIARRYGTSVEALRRRNGIRGSLIRPAQVLVIP
jgi:membrane-bound lytic murein transglycosylase D